MNNLPKVVTQHHLKQDLNSRPTDRKPKRLTRCTTTPPIHQYWPTIRNSTILVVVRVRISIVLGLVRLGLVGLWLVGLGLGFRPSVQRTFGIVDPRNSGPSKH